MFALMPHGSCFLWDPWLTALHVISDWMIVLAYSSIPLMLYLGRAQISAPMRPILMLFAAFILSCGIGHSVRIWNIWHTAYWFEGGWSWLTGTISLYTAWQLKGLLPSLLSTQKDLETVREMATQDHLTGIANRRGLEATLQGLPASKTIPLVEHSLAMIDLDGFKRVNDTYGHQAGDTLLRAVATVMTEQIRSVDLAVRMGGDEFALLLVCCPLQEGTAIAERVRQAISAIAICDLDHPYPSPTGRPIASASIGITQLLPGESLDQCYQRADQALYQSKDNGKNQTCMITPEFMPQSSPGARDQDLVNFSETHPNRADNGR